PTRSTLFPYTTLFRSRSDIRVTRAGDSAAELKPPAIRHTSLRKTHSDPRWRQRGRIEARPSRPSPARPWRDPRCLQRGRIEADSDRKSTRLNSSHDQI